MGREAVVRAAEGVGVGEKGSAGAPLVVALKGADDGEGEIEKVNSVAIPSLAAKLGVGRGDVRCFSSSLYTLGISCKKKSRTHFYFQKQRSPREGSYHTQICTQLSTRTRNGIENP